MASLTNIPRPAKLEIARQIRLNLVARAAGGPAEPPLDEYTAELSDTIALLDQHVSGRDAAKAAREVRLARVAKADIDVTARYRHLARFLSIEANRQDGPYVVECKRLYNAACPDGLGHTADRVVDKNASCRSMLSVLVAPENAALVAAIELPPSWLTRFDAELAESEAAMSAVLAARDDESTHVKLGQNAEGEWVDLMSRLRKYIASRAKRHDAAKITEGKRLLQPLLDALQKLRADAAARATRRKAAAAPSAAPAPVPPSTEVTPPTSPQQSLPTPAPAAAIRCVHRRRRVDERQGYRHAPSARARRVGLNRARSPCAEAPRSR